MFFNDRLLLGMLLCPSPCGVSWSTIKHKTAGTFQSLRIYASKSVSFTNCLMNADWAHAFPLFRGPAPGNAYQVTITPSSKQERHRPSQHATSPLLGWPTSENIYSPMVQPSVAFQTGHCRGDGCRRSATAVAVPSLGTVVQYNIDCMWRSYCT